jgi:chloramphenicol-sensitive protein RarD
MGFAQFLSPTMQFLLGLFVFHENFPARYFASFGIIWLAVILYIISLTQLDKKK